jgi:yecA family protein
MPNDENPNPLDMPNTLPQDLIDALLCIDQVFVNQHGKQPSLSEPNIGLTALAALDGYFAAILSAPEFIMPSVWLPAIWGTQSHDWKGRQEFAEFTSAVMMLYNHVAQSLLDNAWHPLFDSSEREGEETPDATHWCMGYVYGHSLWSPLSGVDAVYVENHLQVFMILPVALNPELFAGDETEDVLRIVDLCKALPRQILLDMTVDVTDIAQEIYERFKEPREKGPASQRLH